MWILQVLEFSLGKLLYRFRGYDAQCFFHSSAFKQHPKPTIAISSPDCGDSNAKFSVEYSKFGSSRFPTLRWPAAAPDVEEYILLSEDPDSPFGHPNVHGIYCFIPPEVNSIGPEDLEVVKQDGVEWSIKSGYRVGKNRRSLVYIPPRPPLGHGTHRYLFELIALNERLDASKISAIPTKEELLEAVAGKVCGWGLWTATFETQWSHFKGVKTQ